MDETYTKIDGTEAWIWVAIELPIVVLGSLYLIHKKEYASSSSRIFFKSLIEKDMTETHMYIHI